MMLDMSANDKIYTTPVTGFGAFSSATVHAIALPSSYRWYCVQAQPGSLRVRGGSPEEIANPDNVPEAIRELHKLGLQTFWPREWDTNRKHQPIARSLFGPYFFTPFDVTETVWRKIHNRYGIRRLMSYDAERPIPLPHGVVQRFIDELGPSGLPPFRKSLSALPALAVGTEVRILDGPLAGLTGIYQRPMHKRVAVLMSLLGGKVEATLARESVEAVV